MWCCLVLNSDCDVLWPSADSYPASSRCVRLWTCHLRGMWDKLKQLSPLSDRYFGKLFLLTLSRDTVFHSFCTDKIYPVDWSPCSLFMQPQCRNPAILHVSALDHILSSDFPAPFQLPVTSKNISARS